VTRTKPPQNAFSAGEISPLLARRFDYQRYQTGVARCRGFLPVRQGPLTRAPGTIHRGATRAHARARLVPFEFAADDALILEFTDGIMRVWRFGSLVEVAGAPYELATPYGEDALDALQWVQSADVIYLADGAQPIQKLSRFALDNWTIAPLNPDTGPFRVQNLDKAVTIQADAVTGTVTLTASTNLFEADHSGVLFRLEPLDWTDVPLWTGETNVDVGDLMRHGDQVYELVQHSNGTSGKTGVNPPVHREGTRKVQTDPDVVWKHVSGTDGIVRITGVVSPTEATAEVVKALPQGVVDDPTYRWAEGAWSPRHGYPAALEIHQQRLVAAATPSNPRTVWFSTTGALEDFEPGTDADSSFAYAIAGSQSVNRILWLREGRSGLHIGALGEELSSRSTERDGLIGPTTVQFASDSEIGSTGARPIAPRGDPMFIAKDGRRLFQIAYSLQADANRAVELSLPSQHLGAEGFAEIAWQSAPQQLAWIRRNSGDLVAMLYDPDEEVLGWAVVPLAGGHVESMAVVPDAAGGDDILTLAVRREIDGATVRFVEEQAVTFGTLIGASDIAQAVHLFAASVFTPDPPTDTFQVPHLAGATVQAWTDAGDYGPLPVAANGEVVLPVAVSRATIGLLDDTHVVELLDIQANAREGSAIGRRKRIMPAVGVAVHRTAAMTVQPVERDLAQPERAGAVQDVIRRQVAADLDIAWTGVAEVPAQTGHAAEVTLRFRPVGGAPATLAAVAPTIEEGGA